MYDPTDPNKFGKKAIPQEEEEVRAPSPWAGGDPFPGTPTGHGWGYSPLQPIIPRIEETAFSQDHSELPKIRGHYQVVIKKGEQTVASAIVVFLSDEELRVTVGESVYQCTYAYRTFDGQVTLDLQFPSYLEGYNLRVRVPITDSFSLSMFQGRLVAQPEGDEEWHRAKNTVVSLTKQLH